VLALVLEMVLALVLELVLALALELVLVLAKMPCLSRLRSVMLQVPRFCRSHFSYSF
jgi:hypothetical protein